ncbi:MAG: hypothetical protein M3Z66_00595, partial [Chloroflexota bacterium]|nr:hypothetical protein [Chloroflexota bacterium]
FLETILQNRAKGAYTLRTSHLARPSLCQSVVTGAVASSGYLAAMEIDMRLTHNRYDDRVFWGGYLTANSGCQKLLGVLLIYVVGTIVATVYRMLLPLLPTWPGPLLGALFVETENMLRFPTVELMSRLNPAVRRGQLPNLWTWKYFWVEAFRHAAFGGLVGLLVKRR